MKNLVAPVLALLMAAPSPSLAGQEASQSPSIDSGGVLVNPSQKSSNTSNSTVTTSGASIFSPAQNVFYSGGSDKFSANGCEIMPGRLNLSVSGGLAGTDYMSYGSVSGTIGFEQPFNGTITGLCEEASEVRNQLLKSQGCHDMRTRALEGNFPIVDGVLPQEALPAYCPEVFLLVGPSPLRSEVVQEPVPQPFEPAPRRESPVIRGGG